MQDSPRHHQDSGSSRLSGRRQDRFFQILKTSSGQWFIDSLQLALDRLVARCNDWQMQIAINKCSMLCVGTMPITPSLNINGFFLPEVTSVKDFGITFDTNLSFTPHITTILLRRQDRFFQTPGLTGAACQHGETKVNAR